ncbi:MAG TPA: hypothetical protein VJN21_02255 [Candidatus Acidoferrales bacterium]|nr:hypothetical protein [Candidatus Acidoferrales bacterium]
MLVLKAGVLYFVVVFAAGFMFGTIRTLWVVPRLGLRRAELLEAPIMFVVTILAARWIVLFLAVPIQNSARLGMGVLALTLLILAELALVRWMRGLSIRQNLATRDPVSRAAYYSLLVLFSVIPLLVARR